MKDLTFNWFKDSDGKWRAKLQVVELVLEPQTRYRFHTRIFVKGEIKGGVISYGSLKHAKTSAEEWAMSIINYIKI